MASDIQKMYEYQEMKGYGGYEYAVRGAEVSCSYGSKTCVLNLKDDHGVHTSDGRPLITENDSTNDNIKGFGMCNKNRSKPCKCDPKLGKWWVTDNSNMKIFDTAVGGERDAVTEDSIAACNKGGIVSFKTSGQVSPNYSDVKIKDAVEIVEDEKKNWRRKSDKKDFIGHVKVKNSGLYNFGIEFYDIKSGNSPGTIFVYEKSWGKTKYIGAYEIKSHVGNKEMKFPDDVLQINKDSYGYVSDSHYWFYWIDIILYGGKDYYFEVDCPGRDGFACKLIGNQDKIISNNIGMAKWTLSPKCKDWSTKNLGFSIMKQYIIYLDQLYINMLYYALLDLEFRKEVKGRVENIIKGALKTAGIIIVGAINDKLGIAVSILDFLSNILDSSEMHILCEQLLDNIESKYIKLIIHEKDSHLSTIRGDGVDKRIVVSAWTDGNTALGEKYLWGEIQMYERLGIVNELQEGKKNLDDEIINQGSIEQ